MKQFKRLLAVILALSMMAGMVSLSLAEGTSYTEEKTKDGWIKITQENGPTLGYSADSGVTILTVDGLAFKDLDKDGELDPFEDWRLTAKERAEDLAGKISIEQISGLRFENGLIMVDVDNAASIIRNDKCTNIFGNNLLTSDTKIVASYVNSVQAIAEGEQYGIPVQFIVDPSTAFTANASQLALAATFDPELVKEVYTEAAKIYRALGITLVYGPQADMSSEPRWKRANATFGEDPQLIADLADAAISGMQSTYAEDGTDEGWGTESIISEVKHYPSDGAAEGGRESHSFFGKYNVYPGQAFETGLVGFNDGAFALDSKTKAAAAVMMSYSIAWDEDEAYGELVGSAFSAYKIALLRDNGYDGVISTDALIDGENQKGVAESVHGMEGYSYEEQIYAIIANGVDRILTPNFMTDTGLSPENISIPQYILMAYNTMVEKEGQEAADANYRESAARILRNYFRTGIFENPYIVEKEAVSAVKAANKNLVNDAAQKSIVLLKNAGNAVHENTTGEKPKVYVPMVYTAATPASMFYGATPASWKVPMDTKTLEEYFTVVTDTVADPTGADGELTENDIVRASAEELASCDMAFVFISNPSTGSGYDSESGTYIPISLQYEEYTADGDNVREESLSQGVVETEVITPYGVNINKTIDDRTYYDESTVASNLSDKDFVLTVADLLPDSCKLVVCVNASNPMIFSEFEDKADVILMNFGVDDSNVLPILAGQVEPTGLLPMQMPADMDTVEAQFEDVPRDMTCYVDAEGNAYDFAYGLNWSGVIDDARTAAYKTEAKTAPENFDLATAD